MIVQVSYCRAVREGRIEPCHTVYHDTDYGFPIRSDDVLFERLVLEINQAGLSWTTILKKREGFRRAYADFRIERVAEFGDADRARLLADAGIIRNRLKVDAAIRNARVALDLIGKHGSLTAWLDGLHPRRMEDWAKIFRKTFAFTGGEIVREFLLSAGYLPGAHDEDCPVGQRIAALGPAWARRSFDRQPTLEGKVLRLRPLRESDFGELFSVASDPAIWELHPARDRYKEDVFRAFFEDAVRSGGALVAIDRRIGRIVGSSRFHGFDAARSEVEIGWSFLARSHWGGVYNGEMKRLMLEHAFRFVESVVFLVAPTNLRSRRAVEKIGGVEDGLRPDDAGRESILYRISFQAR